MAVLEPGVPVTQDDPHLLVENKLSPGRYRFQLVAIDSAGLESAPAQIVVSVQAPAQPEPAAPTRGGPFILRRDILERVTKTVFAEEVKPVLRPGITRLIRPIKPK